MFRNAPGLLLRVQTAILVCLTLCAVLAVAACTSGSEPARTPSPEPSPALTTPENRPAASGPITLTYYEEDGNEADVLLDELAAAFVAANPGITVTRVHYSYNDLRSQFRSAALAGRPPELVRAPGEFAGPFSELQIVQPLDELFSDEYLGLYLRGALAGATVSDTLWAIPDNYDSHLTLIYNRSLFSDTVATNTDAWVAQLQGLTNVISGTYGLVYPLNEAYWLVPWLAGYGGWPVDAQDMPALDTAEMVQALRFLYDLKDRYGVVPAGADYNAAFDLFATGKAAFVIDGEWNLDRYLGLGLDLGIALLPRVSETDLLPMPMATGQYWYIAEEIDPAKLDAAARFVEFMTSAEAQEQWLVRMGRLPSLADVAESEPITSDPLLSGVVAQLRISRGVPPALEMSCAWQGMGAYLPRVMSGEVAPEDAAAAMQMTADQCVAEITLDATPTPAATP